MFTYTFANTPAFRKFFNIMDDYLVSEAEDIIKEFFKDSGVDMDVWLSGNGWVIRNEGYSTNWQPLFNEIVAQIEGK